MRYNQPSPGIFTLSLLQPDECHRVITEVDALHWQDALVSAEPASAVMRDVRSASTHTLSLNSYAWDVMHQRINNVVRPIVYDEWGRDFINHSSIEVVRYSEGGFYKAHRDNGPSTNWRYITIVCYLNDDFKGGGTHFPDAGFTVEPEVGKAALFPSDYVHQANPVAGGFKYVLLAWLIDEPPVKWI